MPRTEIHHSTADVSIIALPGPTSPGGLDGGEGLGYTAWSEDNMDDAELDDEIEAFERSLNTDWEVSQDFDCMLSARFKYWQQAS